MTVNVDVLGSPFLIVLMVTVDVKYCERKFAMVVVEPQNLYLFLFISFPTFSTDVFYTLFVLFCACFCIAPCASDLAWDNAP